MADPRDTTPRTPVPEDEPDWLTLGQAAKYLGMAQSTIRKWSDTGRLPAFYTPGGHRRYRRDVLRRIAFIVFAQRIGMTLDEVGEELAKLPADRVPEGEDWAKLSARWGERIDEHIAELQRLRTGLTGCIGCGCLSLRTCRLINRDDIAAAEGPGSYLQSDR